MTLGLPGRPPAEIIPLTTIVWCEALQSLNLGWDESIDLFRVKEAFLRLSRDSTSWPLPRDFMQQLPARPKPKELPPAPITHADALEILAIIQKTKHELKIKSMQKG